MQWSDSRCDDYGMESRTKISKAHVLKGQQFLRITAATTKALQYVQRLSVISDLSKDAIKKICLEFVRPSDTRIQLWNVGAGRGGGRIVSMSYTSSAFRLRGCMQRRYWILLTTVAKQTHETPLSRAVLFSRLF